MQKNHFIYYFTYHNLLDDGSTLPRQMTSIFGVPFYKSSGINSGLANTWFPFLGLQPFDGDGHTCGWFRKPGFMGISNLDTIPEDISKAFALKGDECYKRLVTVKGMLISAALGGGIWETSRGQDLLKLLKDRYSNFFDYHNLILMDSHKVLNQQVHGILNDTTKGIDWLVKINGMLHLNKKIDLSFRFVASEWVEFLNDTTLLFTENTKALTLDISQTKITDYFPKKFPQFPTRLSPVKYEIIAEINQEQLSELNLTPQEYKQLLEYVSSNYDKELEFYNNTTDAQCLRFDENRSHLFVLSQNMHKRIRVLYLNNGHIVVYDSTDRKIIRSTNEVVIFKAFCVTKGIGVVVKATKSLQATVLPSILHIEKSYGLLELIGISTVEHRNGFFVNALITPLYSCNLLELINANKLSFFAKKKIFFQLLTGLAAIHRTAILYRGKQHSKMYHGDIKPENIFVKLLHHKPTDIQENALQYNDFEACYGDIDTMATFDTYYFTRGFVSPELARIILTFEHGFNKCFMLENNMEFARAADVWALGITLAKVLQTHNSSKHYNSFMPNLNFLSTCQGNEKNSYLNAVSSLQQGQIDNELIAIKASLPDSPEGKGLRVMWDIVHQMLQVQYENRPNIFDVSNNYRTIETRQKELYFTQQLITKYIPEPPTKRQKTLEHYFSKMSLKS